MFRIQGGTLNTYPGDVRGAAGEEDFEHVPLSVRGSEGSPPFPQAQQGNHLDSTGTSGAGVDGLWSISSPSVNVCCFTGRQVTKKHPCVSQSNFLRILGEPPSEVMALFSTAQRGHSRSPPPPLTCSHLSGLSRPARSQAAFGTAVQCGNEKIRCRAAAPLGSYI